MSSDLNLNETIKSHVNDIIKSTIFITIIVILGLFFTLKFFTKSNEIRSKSTLVPRIEVSNNDTTYIYSVH